MDRELPNPDDDARMEEVLKKLDAEEAAQASAEGTEQQVSAPQGEEVGQVETPATGEETGHSEPVMPAIEPPKFLKAEYRDKWKDLPTDWQSYLAKQEEENSKTVSDKLSEAAEQRRRFEAAEKAANERQAAIAQEQQRYAQGLAQVAQYIETADPIISGYNRLVREGRLTTLARENPAQYAELDGAYKTRMNELQALRTEQQRVQSEAMAAHFAAQEQKLREHYPEWADSAKGKAAIDNLRAYAIQNFDFKQEEVQTIGDYRYVRLVDAAYKGEQSQKELASLKAEIAARDKKAAEEAAQAKAAIEAKKVVPKATKVVVPTATGDITGKTAAERNRALIQKAKTVKSTGDKAAILAELI